METDMEPYDDYECRHDRRFDHKGYLKCRDCGKYYNEQVLEWQDSLQD